MHFSSHWRRFALPQIAAVALALVMPLALSPAAFAQDDDVANVPPASGGVARIDAVSGDVAIQRGDANEALAAVPNAPVLGADYVTTGENGRAEVGFDGRAAVRLGANVQIRFSKVDPADRQMQLAAGTIDLRIFGDTDGQSSIDTPSISIVPRTGGSFRVSVDNNGETAVTVRAGRVDVETPQGAQSLEPGTTLIADGAASNPQIQTQAAIALDGFDSYNAERDHIYQVALTDAQYANTNIQGIGELNAAGQWQNDGTYGHVWIPTVAAGWAPYRDGNWVWEDSYGWTWVAAEPWGWAPYHYGRWYYSTAYNHWAWYPPAPGRIAPAWSPALVGFVGFNIGAVNVGIGFGNVGWVPLAPFEAFHPWWGRGATVVNNTTIVNNTYVTNVHYRNLTVNNAMTSVTREDFQGGRFNHAVAVSSEQLRTIQTTSFRGPLPIVPSQANLRFSERSVAPSLAGRPAFANRSFAGHAAVVTRTPFVQQQASVARVTHVAYRPDAASIAPNRAENDGRFGGPSYSRPAAAANGSAYARPESARTGNGDSWSRFNANRTPNTGSAPASYARPGGDATYSRPAPQANTQPQTYNRPAPSYARGGDATLNRQTAPAYTRPAAPAYTRPAAPAYARPAARRIRSVKRHPPIRGLRLRSTPHRSVKSAAAAIAARAVATAERDRTGTGKRASHLRRPLRFG